jgi:site-specific recombinase XerD
MRTEDSNMNRTNTITENGLAEYAGHLANEEKAIATINKYVRDIRAFAAWLSGGEATKEAAVEYKRQISETRKTAGVNSVVAALNSFFAFTDRPIRLKPMKIQRQTYRSEEKELTRAEYGRLCATARSGGNERLFLVMQAICSTGIRVSELRYITVEAARFGTAEITNKSKTRTVFLPRKLQIALLRYAGKRGVTTGCVFITGGGRPLDRSNIWAEMKCLCGRAGVSPEKVFPHNLRRLFAVCFYGTEKDIARLADVLGHSRIDTTRLYIMESGENCRRRVEVLGLVT